ncbi:drug/metabolite transporter (DMT)-like permease [Sporomusaceae bacterium BoRhaA]|uniref:DMT family transporter n=1 Tax=Pelorhabdus rhamnosifermentans TaxID=2772457 RepID=UPI001C063CE0|nr:DMT family transporter [Pelorhabdus rhamnosifermentans]MBU2699317.1 drug/metabolite transporter (DMT)-like permease [Pelorhabdus rhamnosifermentans]
MGLLAIFCTTVLWGLSFVSIKVTVAVIPPMTLAFLRFLIASVILLFLLKRMEPDTRLARVDMPLMALSGLLGITAFNNFQNIGIKMTTASSASMIIAAIPMFTVVGEFLIFKTRLSLLKIISVILSVGGVYCIVAFSQQESTDGFLGNIFMVGAAVAWVAYTLITRPLSMRYSQLAVVTYQIIFGTLALIPFTFFESWEWQSVDCFIILHLIYLGFFCSALANYLYVYAKGVLGVSSVSFFINLIPVISVIGGFTILQEPVSKLQMLGGAIILFSVYIANRNVEKATELSE